MKTFSAMPHSFVINIYVEFRYIFTTLQLVVQKLSCHESYRRK